ncbi:hypothetical protein GCM10023321_48720 [Pseudonocardia eucalypti]|uniref:Uncharacterized protein n=1 Tax=Pseudonocardia eucalypti TaxID=648755 RepID=A0ABP9QJ10_9PSEU|nr:hypothetical protein [Pseudonocardia eucalypti]
MTRLTGRGPSQRALVGLAMRVAQDMALDAHPRAVEAGKPTDRAAANDTAGVLLMDTVGPGIGVLFVVTAVASYLCFRFATRSLNLRGSPEPPDSAAAGSAGSDSLLPQQRRSEPELSQYDS